VRLARPLEGWLLDRESHDLGSELVVANHGVVEDLLRALRAVGHRHLRLGHLLALLDLEAEEDVTARAEELEHREELPVGAAILLDRALDARSEHLLEVTAGHPARRDVEAIRLGAELRVEGQRHLALADEIPERVLRVVGPAAVLPDLHEALEPNLPDARRHATSLRRLAVRADRRVLALDSRIAGDALLARPGRRPIHGLLVRAAFDALSVAATTALVDEDDSVLRTFVDRLARTRREASGIGAVVADSREVEEPHLVLGELGRAAELLVLLVVIAGRGVLVDVRMAPFVVRRQVAERATRTVRTWILLRGLEDRHAVESAVGALLRVGWRSSPDLASGVRLLEHVEELRVPLARVAAE